MNFQTKYVQVSVKSIFEDERRLIQLIDISDTVQAKELKSDNNFLEIINKSLFQYLKSPLNSLFGQIFTMKEFYKNFQTVIESNSNPEQAKKLRKV